MDRTLCAGAPAQHRRARHPAAADGGIVGARGCRPTSCPAVKIPAINLIWTYPGLNAPEMASKISTFGEIAILNNVDNIRDVRSETLTGVAIIRVTFQPGTDVTAAFAQITSVSQTILRRMPPGTSPPLIVPFVPSSVPVLQLVLASDTLNSSALFDYGRLQLRSQIQSIPGLRLTLPYGGASRQVMIDLKPEALQAYGVSPKRGGARDQHAEPDPADRRSARREPRNRRDDQCQPGDGGAVRRPAAALVDGRVVRVGDVAIDPRRRRNSDQYRPARWPERGHRRDPEAGRRLHGRYRPAGEGEVAGVARLRAAGDHHRTRLRPVGVRGERRRQRAQGSDRRRCLVAFVVLVFLGSWRSSLIVLTSIPLALLASVAGLALTGQTFNLMTLGGLMLAIGILVDNALVEIENINRNLENGMPLQRCHPEECAGGRVSGIRLDAGDLHRVLAAVPADGNRRLYLHSAGAGGRVRDDRLLYLVAHTRAVARRS